MVFFNQFSGFWRIAAGVTANVQHQNFQPFHGKKGRFREIFPQRLPVNVSVNSPHHRQLFQLFNYTGRANIPGVPYFITNGEKFGNTRMDKTMRVGYETYLFQTVKSYTRIPPSAAV